MEDIFGPHISAETTPVASALAEQHKENFMRFRLGDPEPVYTDEMIDVLFDQQQRIIDALGQLEAKMSGTGSN
ncbi:hypothetical protein [Glutamicibacter soli]